MGWLEKWEKTMWVFGEENVIGGEGAKQLVGMDGSGDSMLVWGKEVGYREGREIKIQCFLCLQQLCRVREGGWGYKLIPHYPHMFIQSSILPFLHFYPSSSLCIFSKCLSQNPHLGKEITNHHSWRNAMTLQVF